MYAHLWLPHTSIYYYLANFNLTWFSINSQILSQIFSVDSFIVLSFGIPDEPPCYVRQYTSLISLFIYEMSRGKFTAYKYIYMLYVLQYTTAHLQVLFSLQLLGGITKVLQ